MNISTFIWGGRRTLSSFAHRHIGIRSQDLPNMLSMCKTESLDKLIDNVNPNSHKIPYDIPDIPETVYIPRPLDPDAADVSGGDAPGTPETPASGGARSTGGG